MQKGNEVDWMTQLLLSKKEIANHEFLFGRTAQGLAFFDTLANKKYLPKYFKGYEFVPDSSPDEEFISQLEDYFQGKEPNFSVTLDLIGTDFQKEVWQELVKVPYGQTTSYQALAIAINRPKAIRAVGGAVGRNPVMLVVPCHRVIGKNGQLTGFRGGIPLKKELLAIENQQNPKD